MCDSSSTATIYVAPLILVLLIPSFLMGMMAYRTKDVDEAFSESKWILVLIIVGVMSYHTKDVDEAFSELKMAQEAHQKPPFQVQLSARYGSEGRQAKPKNPRVMEVEQNPSMHIFGREILPEQQSA
ncbi:hypothetical protein ACA910_015178 [Epithemia clementina (nom. ined.)]